jgi:hypothetical protein
MTEVLDGDADIDWLVLQLRKGARASIIGAMYFASCIIFGVPLWKACVVALAIICLQAMHLGARHVQQFGLLAFMIAGIYWVDIVPLQKWAHMAGAKIETILAGSF